MVCLTSKPIKNLIAAKITQIHLNNSPNAVHPVFLIVILS